MPDPDGPTPSSRFSDPEVRLRVLDAAVDQAGEAVIILRDARRDGRRRVVYVNRAFTTMTGYSPREIIGRTLYVLKGPETSQTALDRIAEAFDRKSTVREQLLNYRKDGSRFWADCTLAPVEDEVLDGTFWISIQRDITSRVEAERSLRSSEARFRLVADNMRDLITLHTPDGSCEWVSASVQSMLGYTPPEYTRMRPYASVHPADRSRVRQDGHLPILHGSKGTRLTYRLRRRDGSHLWVESLTRPVVDDEDRVIKLQAATRDVTERKRFETELVQAKEQAEKMSRLKSAILANMSHEVRTPLTNVIGFADVLAETLQGDEAEFVRLIQNGGRRLLRTLNSVLEFARLESESVNLDRTTVDLADVVRNTVALFQREARQRGLRLQMHLPDRDESSAPPADASTAPAFPVWGDQTALERILNNLLSNALKFTEDGGVTVGLNRQGRTVHLTVQDTGVGITDAFLPSLFDPFEQESVGFGRAFEGAGLGLSITHQLVELHGGSIDVQSRKGEGTTFTVALPSADGPGSSAAIDGGTQ